MAWKRSGVRFSLAPQMVVRRSPHVVHVVATTAFAGVERYLTYVAPPLVEQGIAVTVVGGDPTRMTAAFHGTGVVHVPHTGLVGTGRWLRTASPRPDLVHVHMTAAELVAARALPRSGPALVSTRHFAAGRGSSPLSRLATRGMNERLAAQIAISRYVAESVDEPTEVIANGVPLAPQGPHDQPVVLLAQRLEAEKQTAVALRAWAATDLAERGWLLHVAGAGAERAELEALSLALGVDGSVRFLGAVEDVGLRMATCGVFVATAPAEPFGLSVAEAMATGAAVVAADGGAHRELLVEGCGVLVAAGDPAALAAALVAAVDDPIRRATIGVAARSRQALDYSVDTHVTRLVALYERVLAERSAPGSPGPGPTRH